MSKLLYLYIKKGVRKDRLYNSLGRDCIKEIDDYTGRCGRVLVINTNKPDNILCANTNDIDYVKDCLSANISIYASGVHEVISDLNDTVEKYGLNTITRRHSDNIHIQLETLNPDDYFKARVILKELKFRCTMVRRIEVN